MSSNLEPLSSSSLNIEIRVEKCSGSNCKPPDEFEKYVEPIYIQTWIGQEQVLFIEYGKRPTHKMMVSVD